MTAARHGGSWYNQNYDKLILFVVLASLFGSALFLVLEIARVKQDLQEAHWEKPLAAPNMVKPVDLAAFDQEREALTKPFQGASYSNLMLVSALRVSCVECGKPVLFSAEKCPFCGAVQPVVSKDADQDLLPDEYEVAHGMNPYSPDDAAEDWDKDGFSNLEEYQSGTDIKDAQNLPSAVGKLRYVRITPNPFKLRFQGTAKLPDGSVRYQLNLRTLERTYFVRIGDEIEGFKVEEFVADAPEGPVIVLKQGDQRIRLVKGRAITQFEMVADLVFLIDRATYRVRVGDAINVKEHEYNVIDIKPNGVTIRDIKNKKETLIGPLSESEKMALTGGQEIPPPAGGAPPGMPRPLK
ncbi:MAG: Amuc_1099 family pilus-like system protein [Verrucomicrobiota bacterium]